MKENIEEYAKRFNPTKEGIEKLKQEYRETTNEIIPELDRQIEEISNQLKELNEERKAKYDRKCFLEELSQKSGIDIL